MSSGEVATVTLTRTVNAPRERVFEAWIEPEMIRKWIVAPRPQDEVLGVEVDTKVGGAFSFRIRRDGQTIDHFGTYLEIERPARLVFTFDARLDGAPPGPSSPTHVALDFAEHEGRTTITLTASNLPREHAARAEQGWTKILEAVIGVTPRGAAK